jgi:RNA polymerase sigma factor (sigma-70 family)
VTETLTLQETGDAELISAVRGGDVSAYGPLFERHVEAARRLARQLVGAADADDLVSDAFAKVLRVLQGGGGPDVAFRAYLLTSIRRLHVDRIRATSRLHSTDDMEAFDPGVPFRDTAVEGFESAAAAKAFASLPERWQAVLWHTEVEGQKPAEVAALLGMTPNSVSALAYRAREGLRQAFLNSHAMDVEDDACAWTHQHLGGYIRNGISKRDAGKVEKHIDECRKCMAIYLELTEVNNNLAAILAPLLLGSAGIGYLASAGVATKGAFLLLVDRVKDGIGSNGPAAAAAGVVAAGVIAASAVFALQSGDKATPPRADAPPPGARSSALPPAATDTPSDAPTTTPTQAPTSAPAKRPTASATASTSPTASASATVSPSPTTTPTPSPTPTPTPVSSNVAFASAPTATATNTGSGSYTITVSASGIPAGQTVEVTSASAPSAPATARLATATATSAGGVAVACEAGDCVLTSSRTSLTLTADVTGTTAQDLTITLVPSAGINDPDASDNSTTLRLEPPAPPVTGDASVAVTFLPPQGLGDPKRRFDISATGVPAGESVTMTVTWIGLTPGSVPVGCTDAGTSWTCLVTSAGLTLPSVDFRTSNLGLMPSVTAALSLATFTDTDTTNDSDTAAGCLLDVDGVCL